MIAVIFLISIASFFFKAFIGIILLLGIGLYLFLKLYKLPKDEDIDNLCRKRTQTILEQGYEKLGLTVDDESLREPIILQGPSFDEITYDPAIKKGKDKIVRSSNHQVSVFYFGREQVYLYQQTFSVIDHEQNEIIDSYFYEDVVSVTTSSKVISYYNELLRRDAFVNFDAVTLHTTGSSAIECSIQNIDHTQEKVYELKILLGTKKRQY